MTILQFQYALACSATGSISKAAETLFTSVSNLSKTLKALEDELGFQIFVRDNNGVIPTERGERFLSYAAALMEQYDQISNLDPRGMRCQFSCSCNPIPSCFSAFQELCRRYQQESINFKLQQAPMAECLERVSKYKSQIAVVVVPPHSEAAAQELFKQYHVSAALMAMVCVNVNLREGHPLLADYKKGHFFDFRLLRDYPFVNYIYLEEGLPRPLPLAYGMIDINPQKTILLNSMEWKTQMITNTDAFGIGIEGPPEFAAFNKWVCIPIPGCVAKIYRIKPANAGLNAEAKEYLAILQNDLERLSVQ